MSTPSRPVAEPLFGGLLLCVLGVANLFAVVWAGLAFAMASDPCAWEDCASTGLPRLGIAVAYSGAGVGALVALVGYGRAFDDRRITFIWPIIGFAFTVVGWLIGAWLAAPVR
ncbi:Uncharacterised protein (plasmid) [Tsukamurella tyrosinosolvens]|uniref:Uncharacterized protein n=1 Tax=Tsukamurella tyrosinosolvens TaxID=57704 RepID=A0A1H4Y047_TSUTY|nr:hypothetical protein [Tsukamurella tyrosinosolvens]KXO99998.1 hypothetical protein AXK58_02075 [Tsukamurella tyrosinosolvens]MEC4613739.1 hypothetical protein [Tsukamurella tyrosinosolvens]SED11187.1 hypothetical protein SAMN04489793_4006 [Tsukamurella tyrosinosolvens]VEH97724.1 Uncharacterised protein [Tsukamurella tyrosinosolvens]